MIYAPTTTVRPKKIEKSQKVKIEKNNLNKSGCLKKNLGQFSWSKKVKNFFFPNMVKSPSNR
jgi:hypothetical protein